MSLAQKEIVLDSLKEQRIANMPEIEKQRDLLEQLARLRQEEKRIKDEQDSIEMELAQINRPSSALEKSFREATAEVEGTGTPTSKDLDTSARAK